MVCGSKNGRKQRAQTRAPPSKNVRGHAAQTNGTVDNSIEGKGETADS
jgi:hypothetical protein